MAVNEVEKKKTASQDTASSLKYKEVEHALITTHRKSIWRPFMKAIRTYRLIEEGDKIAVCISGGKDSFLLAKCMEELKKHGQVSFDLIYLVMNPGYRMETLEQIKKNGQLLHIPLTFFDSNIFEISTKLDAKHPCFLCARMRRGALYEKAKQLGCNKIALGHHFDDVVETILLSQCYGGEYKSMLPKLKSTNFEGMELIRPLYLVKEKDIIQFGKANGLSFINCACAFTEKKAKDSKREEMKELLGHLREKSSLIDQNIFKASENVNLNTVLGYQKGTEKHNFLEDYE